VDRGHFARAVVAVTRNGAKLHEGAYGMADLAHGIPLDRRSVLRIGSQTKQFTVLLALLLEAEGKLSLDDEVHRHAPWLPRYPNPVTLRHLAGNTGGLRDFLEIMIWSGLSLGAPSSRQTARDLLARHDEVNFPPQEQMLYSNTGSSCCRKSSRRSLGAATTNCSARGSQGHSG